VKFVRKDEDRLVFRLGQREYRLMIEVLSLYPLIPSSHHRLSRTADAAQIAADQRMLEEALQVQKREGRRQLDAAIKEGKLFTPEAKGCKLELNAVQAEWFLQVLNDIRVGSWLKLGCPDESKDRPGDLTRANVRYFVAMEVCGMIQATLLQALGDDPGEAR
jgi:hypothetical protein